MKDKIIFEFPVFLTKKHEIDIHDVVSNNILNYMGNNKIKFSEVVIKKSESHKGFEAEENGTPVDSEKLKIFNEFLKDQHKIENLLELIMKEMYGTWTNMERHHKVKHIKPKMKRGIKNFIKLLDMFDCRPFIIINDSKIKYKIK